MKERMNKNLNAMFLPLISKEAAGRFLLCSAILLGLGMFLLPAHGILPLSKIAIPDALAMGRESEFPFALTVSYSFAIYAALFCGLLTAFAEGNLDALSRTWGARGRTFRALFDVLFALVVYLLLTQELIPINRYQLSYSFFSHVLVSRVASFFWVEGVFGFIYCASLVFLFDVSNFIRKVACKQVR